MNFNPHKRFSRDTLKSEAQPQEKISLSFDKDFSKASDAVILKKAQVKHKHKRAMREKDLGLIGRLLGGEQYAPLTLALFAITIGAVMMFLALILEALFPDDVNIWNRAINGSITLISTSLAYSFGRASHRSSS